MLNRFDKIKKLNFIKIAITTEVEVISVKFYITVLANF